MVPFPTYPYVRKYKIFHIFSGSKYFLPWTYCVSKSVVQLPSFYLTVTLQVGTAFGGRSHGSYSIDLGNVSSCTFDAFLRLMFPLNTTTCEEGHPQIEREREAWRSHWAQIHGAAGPGHYPAFCPSGPRANSMPSAPSRRTEEMCL